MNGEKTCWIEVLNEDWDGPLKLHVRGRSMWPTLRPDDQVTVEPTTTDNLHPGDWVLLQGRGGLFLHRFLGVTREGLLLTKGDGHRALDSPWPPDALRGRAVALSRHGKTTPVSSLSLRERMRTLIHRLMATAWSFVRRCVHRTGLLTFLLLGVSVTTVLAAVTLTSFTATPQEDSILIEWETASEVDMFGFYVQRAPYVTPGIGNCAAIPNRATISPLIPSEGDIVGASYDFTDASAEVGSTYYYCLQAVEVDNDFELHGPISAAIQPAPTTEPTSTPSPTPTSPSAPPPPPPPTTSTPAPTSIPGPTSPPPTGTPPTATPTRTPTRTVTHTPLATGGGEDTPTQTPPPATTRTSTTESTIVIATAIPEPDVESSDATTTPDSNPASQPTALPTLIPQATAISPTASERPRPSPSPDSSGDQLTRSTANGKGSPFPWGLILALIIAAGVLILLGGLGLWWMRQKK